MATELVINAQTGETSERELTAEELAAIQATPEELAAIEHDRITAQLRGAYATEADPLYFGWQRGENTEQAWLDKVAEIRTRYPYLA